jgi:ferredoxin--NADP+ reductase
VFVAGWSREASSGLVGVARKDGENGARALLQYLQGLSPVNDKNVALVRLSQLLHKTGQPVISKDDVKRLEAFERAEAERQGLEEFKLKTNQEMLAAMGLA